MSKKTTYANLINRTNIPQREALDSRQVENNAGGFVYQISKWDRLHRFLVIGSDSPTYYQSASKLSRENAKIVDECYAEDAEKTISLIVNISESGRAPKQDPAIFALALGTLQTNLETRRTVYSAIRQVCRTSTHLFMFLEQCKLLGKGWGSGIAKAVGRWYDSQDVDKLAYQAIKYRAREGWTHRDVLRTAHPPGDHTGQTLKMGFVNNELREIRKGSTLDQSPRAALYRWMADKPYDRTKLPALVTAHLEAMQSAGSDLYDLIREHNLPWEAIPTEANTDPKVWQTMLPKMGLTALVRNLGRMTRLEAIKPLSNELSMVIDRLIDQQDIRRSRVHPFNLLLAQKVYRNGQGFANAQFRGKRDVQTWRPLNQVADALDEAFYLAFQNVVPSNKRVLLALDISGSMAHGSFSQIKDTGLTAREGAAAMALITAATEKKHHIVAFSAAGPNGWTPRTFQQGQMTWHQGRQVHIVRSRGYIYGYPGPPGISEFDISPRMRLTDVVNKMHSESFGATDCALPMLYAIERKLEVDAFVIYTDNETGTGTGGTDMHPVVALQEYRKKMGIPAKLIVVGMTSTGFSIADPNDKGMLDIVGFDSAAPAVIADFIAQ